VIIVVVPVIVAVLVIPMAVVVIFMIPVAFVQLPSLLIVVVVGMIPIGTRIGRLLPASRNPPVMVTIGGPVAFNPGVAWAGRIASAFVAYRRGCAADIQRNLR
jgi:hypothetical protein